MILLWINIYVGILNPYFGTCIFNLDLFWFQYFQNVRFGQRILSTLVHICHDNFNEFVLVLVLLNSRQILYTIINLSNTKSKTTF